MGALTSLLTAALTTALTAVHCTLYIVHCTRLGAVEPVVEAEVVGAREDDDELALPLRERAELYA